jgi:hypothetical protein
MTFRKLQPLFPRRTDTRCPVCGEASYSLAGIHPQCSVLQADERRDVRTRKAVPTVKKAKSTMPVPR